MRRPRQKVRLLQPSLKPRVIRSARHLGAQLVKSLRRVAVRSFASVARPTALPTRPTTPWTAQAIIRENYSHLKASDREKLLSVLLRFESPFDGTLGDCNLPPISFKLKEGMKPYNGRPYPILHKHKAVLMKEINDCATLEC
jgi:hypothetical protein